MLGRKQMTRGPTTRLDAHPVSDSGGVLASFAFGVWNDELEQRLHGLNGNCLEDSSSNNEISLDQSPSLLLRPDPTIFEDFDNKTVGGTTRSEIVSLIPAVPVDSSRKPRYEVVGPRSVAIWDRSDPSRILAVFILFLSDSKSDGIDFRQELLLMDAVSHHIHYRALLPMKMSGSKYQTTDAINQSERGTYSIAATSAKGGIRLFRTEGLFLLGIYGEGVSLHGHTIYWQDCFFVQWGGKPSSVTRGAVECDVQHPFTQRVMGRIIETDDELQRRFFLKEPNALIEEHMQKDSLENLHIVGVPAAFREPIELNDTIHFWDLSMLELVGGIKLPSFTLKAPGKAASIASLRYLSDPVSPTNGRLLITTHHGDFYQLAPTLGNMRLIVIAKLIDSIATTSALLIIRLLIFVHIVSDWAGTMYPPQYQIIDDNICYIEDEDALDSVVDKGVDEMIGEIEHLKEFSQFESDLEEALRLSRLNQNAPSTGDFDSIIDVVGCGSGSLAKVSGKLR